jgi:hypothetical protein
MRIDSSGNVGIGTSSPADKLDVNGRSTFRDNIRLPNTNYIYSYAGGTATTVRSGFYLDGTNNILTALTNDAERMRINSSGNVGINTSSPGARLDVNGVVRGTRFSTLEQQYSVNNSSYDWNISSIIGTIPDVENSISFELTLRERSTGSLQLFRLFYIRIGPTTTFNISSAIVSFGSSAATTTISYPSAGTLRFTNTLFSVGDALLRRISS